MLKGWGMMRRAMLLILGFGAGGMMLLAFLWMIQVQQNGAKTVAFLQYDTFYPRSVMGTQLLAVKATRYDGPYWEDGTNEEVTGVAGLVVENHGGLLISAGAVIVEMGKERLVFELSFLPPGGKMLVLEKDRKPYTHQNPISCYGWTKEEYPENPGLVSVDTVGLDGLTLTNYTGCTVPGVQVQYKNYDQETNMFLGGITYCLEESDLLPREVRMVSPAYYTARGSRVVRILPDMDR